MHFVYVLRSDKTTKPYTGFTNNLERRLAEHNHRNNEDWTGQFKPWRIVAFVSCDTEATAVIVEAFFKNTSGKEKFTRFAAANPHHPNPKQGFFDTLEAGRGFGSNANRFYVHKVRGRTIMKMTRP